VFLSARCYHTEYFASNLPIDSNHPSMTENIENGLYPQPATSEVPARAHIIKPELA
jgi:hypothetical protein